jgi:hypothetical protein
LIWCPLEGKCGGTTRQACYAGVVLLTLLLFFSLGCGNAPRDPDACPEAEVTFPARIRGSSGVIVFSRGENGLLFGTHPLARGAQSVVAVGGVGTGSTFESDAPEVLGVGRTQLNACESVHFAEVFGTDVGEAAVAVFDPDGRRIDSVPWPVREAVALRLFLEGGAAVDRLDLLEGDDLFVGTAGVADPEELLDTGNVATMNVDDAAVASLIDPREPDFRVTAVRGPFVRVQALRAGTTTLHLTFGALSLALPITVRAI